MVIHPEDPFKPHAWPWLKEKEKDLINVGMATILVCRPWEVSDLSGNLHGFVQEVTVLVSCVAKMIQRGLMVQLLLFCFGSFQWNMDLKKKQEKYWVLCRGYFCLAKYCVNSLADAWKVVFAGNNEVFISVSHAQNNLLFWNMAQVKMLDVYVSLEELFHIIAWR